MTRKNRQRESTHGTSFVTRVKEVRKSSKETIVKTSRNQRISLPRFAYVRPGDVLDISKQDGELAGVYKRVHPISGHEVSHVQLYPTYSKTETIFLPPHAIEVTFRERRSESDWRSVRQLEQFHYRGNGLSKIVGRRTVLLAEAKGIGVIGFGVISATVAFCKPRCELFAISVGELLRTKLINRIARIPRIVVHPEFRGLGLGAALARHLVAFAECHWDINGYKPIMVEVIASMTDYHRFFEHAGFVEAGRTKGSARIFVPKYGNGAFESRPNASQYKFFSPLGPKPYLICPISTEVKSLLRQKEIIADERIAISRTPPLLSQPIQINNLCFAYKFRSSETPRAQQIGTVFGLNGSQMQLPVLNNLTCQISPGDVVVITGASGSGKSSFIKLFNTELTLLKKTASLTGEINLPRRSKVAVLTESPTDARPLIDLVGRTLEESVALLNTAGLAEAHLYLKTPTQVSEGQRYRFAVAQLCDSKKPIWVADEFASNLDSVTAAVVAKGLRRLAYLYGATVILAAPHVDHFIESLYPTQIIKLSWGGEATILGLRLRSRIVSGVIKLYVENIGTIDLNVVKVVITNSRGEVTTALQQTCIRARHSGDVIEVALSDLRVGDVIRATSQERVGDLVYVTST